MFLYMQEMEDPTLAAMATVLIAFSIVAVVLLHRLSKGVNVSDILGRRNAP
jgi:ABC-type spermidine/putrescine transport system permease subunit II